VVSGGASIRYRDLIVALAAQCKLPAVYWERFFVVASGLTPMACIRLISIAARGGLRRSHSQGREACRPAGPAGKRKSSCTLTSKSAKALGIIVPLPVSGRADEVIE